MKIDLNILPQLNKTIIKDLYMCFNFTIRKTYMYAYIHYSFLRKEPKSKKKLRRPGIEPGSTAWKATMLTITPPTLVSVE